MTQAAQPHPATTPRTPPRLTRLRSSTTHPAPADPASTAGQLERRRQVRGLVLLALLAIAVSILRAGIHSVFTRGWWRLW